MLKRLRVLISPAILLLTYLPASTSVNEKDSVFLSGSLWYNLELYEVYCPYELHGEGDFLWLFDSDQSCYKLDIRTKEIVHVFSLSGCSKMPVRLHGENVCALITENPTIQRYTVKNGQSNLVCLPKVCSYIDFAVYDKELFIVADDSEYLYRLINHDGEIVRNGRLRTENAGEVSCIEYNVQNDILAIVSPRYIEIVKTTNDVLKTTIHLDHCMDVIVSEKNIYALCPYFSDNPKENQNSSLHVFDLEGKLLKIYVLDTRICKFSLLADDKVLYGLTLEEELPIVKFELER
ncbi:MAG: hypothetical protein PHF92_09520 [Bacteroidales bacterium]|nr:hypothetical protein [Bacteroidales bacterium]